jgi:hypothetical protein
VPANPGGGGYVLDRRTGEFVQQAGLPVELIAQRYEERHP